MRLRERLSLPAHDAVLNKQLDNLREYSREEIVIDRRGGPISSGTWLDIRSQCMLYLGFLHKHIGVLHPNLEHFTRGDLLQAYFLAKGKRGDRGTSVCKIISVARRVVAYWKSESPAQEAELRHLDEWLGKWGGQARAAWPSQKRNVAVLQQQGKWEDAPALLALFVRAKAEALAGLGGG